MPLLEIFNALEALKEPSGPYPLGSGVVPYKSTNKHLRLGEVVIAGSANYCGPDILGAHYKNLQRKSEWIGGLPMTEDSQHL